MPTGAQVWSTTAASNNVADSQVNWSEGMAPSAVNDSARGGMASVAMFIGDNSGVLVTSGTTTAYTIGSKQISTGVADGYTIAARIHATNDVNATLNVDGVGPKSIQTFSGQNLSLGTLVAGSIQRFTYNTASTAWILNSFLGSTGAAQLVPDGSVGTPSYAFSSDQDCGLYRIGSNDIGMASGSVKITEWTTSGFTVNGTLTSSGAATFVSSSTFGNSVQINAGLAATGFAQLGSSAEIAGAALIGGTGTISGAATMSSSLAVGKGTAVSSNLSVGGTAGFTGGVTMSSTLHVVGNVSITGALTVGTGSGQIPFPAAQNPSTDANTLDDYEEGTWTPALKFGGNSIGVGYASQVGTYIKIGRLVHVDAYFVLNSNGSSVGDATITGLPFANNSSIQSVLSGRYGQDGGSQPIFNLAGVVAISASSIDLWNDNATLPKKVSDANLNDTAFITLSGSYMAAS